MLTPKQEQFCQEYLIDLNGTRAAVRAGYSARSATYTAADLFALPHVKERIDELMQTRAKRTEISQDFVINKLYDIVNEDIKNYVSFKPRKVKVTDRKTGKETEIETGAEITVRDSDTVDTHNIAEISVSKYGNFKLKLSNRESALLLLAKHLGMFTDKVQHQHSLVPFTGTVPVIDIMQPAVSSANSDKLVDATAHQK